MCEETKRKSTRGRTRIDMSARSRLAVCVYIYIAHVRAVEVRWKSESDESPAPGERSELTKKTSPRSYRISHNLVKRLCFSFVGAHRARDVLPLLNEAQVHYDALLECIY